MSYDKLTTKKVGQLYLHDHVNQLQDNFDAVVGNDTLLGDLNNHESKITTHESYIQSLNNNYLIGMYGAVQVVGSFAEVEHTRFVVVADHTYYFKYSVCIHGNSTREVTCRLNGPADGFVTFIATYQYPSYTLYRSNGSGTYYKQFYFTTAPNSEYDRKIILTIEGITKIYTDGFIYLSIYNVQDYIHSVASQHMQVL